MIFRICFIGIKNSVISLDFFRGSVLFKVHPHRFFIFSEVFRTVSHICDGTSSKNNSVSYSVETYATLALRPHLVSQNLLIIQFVQTSFPRKFYMKEYKWWYAWPCYERHSPRVKNVAFIFQLLQRRRRSVICDSDIMKKKIRSWTIGPICS